MQLNLFIPPSVTRNAALLSHLHEVWPIVEPWGDLSTHRICRVVQTEPQRLALLLESSTGHRWHMLWFDGSFYASSAGWRDVDGRRLDTRKAA
jgi:hypothetical protein